MLVDNDKQFPIRQNYKGGKWEFVENDKVSWDYYFKRKSKSKIPVVIISLIPWILIPFIIYISCVFLVSLNYCMKLEIFNLLFYSNLQDRKKKGIYNSGTLVISIFIRLIHIGIGLSGVGSTPRWTILNILCSISSNRKIRQYHN